MKNYLFAAVGIVATIAVAGGLTLTAGVASACMIALVSLLEVNLKKRERNFIDTDRQRVITIGKKSERIFDLECANFELTDKVASLQKTVELDKLAQIAKTKPVAESKPVATKTKRKTTK